MTHTYLPHYLNEMVSQYLWGILFFSTGSINQTTKQLKRNTRGFNELVSFNWHLFLMLGIATFPHRSDWQRPYCSVPGIIRYNFKTRYLRDDSDQFWFILAQPFQKSFKRYLKKFMTDRQQRQGQVMALWARWAKIIKL